MVKKDFGKHSRGFFSANRAGDAALDLGGGALCARSAPGLCIDKRYIFPMLSRSESTHPVKGQARRHRLFRTPGMSKLVAPPGSLSLPEMLDEPTARCFSGSWSVAPIGAE